VPIEALLLKGSTSCAAHGASMRSNIAHRTSGPSCGEDVIIFHWACQTDLDGCCQHARIAVLLS